MTFLDQLEEMQYGMQLQASISKDDDVRSYGYAGKFVHKQQESFSGAHNNTQQPIQLGIALLTFVVMVYFLFFRGL